MFEVCNKVDKVCCFCGKSYYSPKIEKNDDKLKCFCGIAGGYDTRVSSLPECWLKMSKSQRITFTKKKKDEYQALILRGKR